MKQYKEKKINLEATFDGKSPFHTDERSEDLDAADFKPKVIKDTIEYPIADINPDDVPF